MRTLFSRNYIYASNAPSLLSPSNRWCSLLATFRLRNQRKMAARKTNQSDGEMSVQQSACTVSLNVLQNGSFGFYRSMYLATDTTTYMFNCPEGNSRLLPEQGLRRPPSIKHVFFTHGSWQNVSGLAGLAAYLKSVQIKELHLHGPPGLTKIVNVARSFHENARTVDTIRPRLEDDGFDAYEDSNIAIECVPFTTSEEKDSTLREYLEESERTGYSSSTCPIRASDLSVGYVVTVKPKWGKVIPEKCMALGVQVGPAIGLLQRGLVAKNRDGQDVHPDQVREPPLPPHYLAVIDCPDERFLDSLTRSRAFDKFCAGSPAEQLRLLVHFSPARVMERDEYRNWIKRFPSSTSHWICNDAASPICHLDGVYRSQLAMNSISDQMFPLLWHHRISSAGNSTSTENTFSNAVFAEPFTKYSIRPPNGFQPIVDDIFDQQNDQKTQQQPPPETKALEAFHREAATFKRSGDAYPTVTFFGTAASTPTKYRNLSGILLEIDERASVMLDCGESTVSQMRLYFGKEQFERRLVNLKAVFISHLHLDHHFGLYSLVLERKLAFEKLNQPYETLAVLAASPLFRAHSEFSKIVEDISTLCRFYSTARDEKLPVSLAELAEILRLSAVDVAKVIHPQCATGFVLVTSEGKKIVYSGDTRPCEELIKKGLNADLLIHEATLNDGWEEEAAAKKHCTKSEAIGVSRAMNARWTILTHFTGLNSKLAYIDEKILNENPTIGLACDFMTVKWDQLQLVPKLIPAIYELRSDYVAIQQGTFRKKRVAVEIEDEEPNASEEIAEETNKRKRDVCAF